VVALLDPLLGGLIGAGAGWHTSTRAGFVSYVVLGTLAVLAFAILVQLFYAVLATIERGLPPPLEYQEKFRAPHRFTDQFQCHAPEAFHELRF
jgi:hypothetical protein